jgi:hypothetical protein
VPNTTVKVPVKVILDPGTSGLTMEFVASEGFEITGYEWGTAYPAADAVEWNPDTKTIVWADPNGTTTVANTGDVVLYLTVTIPANVEMKKEYPVVFNKDVLSASGETGVEHDCSRSTDGWIMATDSGDVVFGIADTEAFPGDKVDIPVNILFDKGADSFTFDIVLPEGMTIDSVTYDPDYEKNGTFTFDPTTGTVTWKKNADSDWTPDPASNILTVTATVPDGIEPGEYTVTLGNVDVKNADGDTMAYDVVNGTLTVKEPSTTFIVTDYTVTFTPPTRENYWSHDSRKFGTQITADTNDGLRGLEAYADVNYYSVNEKTGYFVDADGNVLKDATGNPMVYDPNGTNPAAAILKTERVDLTPYVRAKYAEVKDPNSGTMKALDTPEGLWLDKVNQEIAKGNGTKLEDTNPGNVYELEFYYYSEDDPNKLLGDLAEPLLMGTKTIYIGVKGDINLSNNVDITDAKTALDFHVSVHLTYNTFEINSDPILGRYPDDFDGQVGLCYYLANVKYIGANEPYLDITDAKMILDYHVARNLTYLDVDWADEKIVGYDFPDDFYGGEIPADLVGY